MIKNIWLFIYYLVKLINAIDYEKVKDILSKDIESEEKVDEILSRINKIISNKKQEIILYCISGSRSKKVQKKLQKMGYTNVYNLYNGIENYWDF